MVKEEVKKFITKQLDDLDDFIYTIEEEDSYIYVNFTQIFSEKVQKELTFKSIDNKLYYHSLSYGWKVLSVASNNKYFWIDIVNKD